MSCPLCQSNNFELVYDVKEIPVFQNKVYATLQKARAAVTANVSLSQCNHCSFVFNSDFNPEIMNYDNDYQNDQSCSPSFKRHLENVLHLIEKKELRNKTIIEIGCGKGFFLEKLTEAGFNVTGFDPAYEGSNPHIIKEYFTEKHSGLHADLILFRHVLEHIHNPLAFLHDIARAVNHSSMIYIEVPGLKWILDNQAYWDIFYEHCNYFTIETLSSLFNKSETGYLFGEQYIYIMADLKDLKDQVPDRTSNPLNSQSPSNPSRLSDMFSELNKKLISHQRFIQDNIHLTVWGAGAKGSTFVNLTDPQKKHIDFIVDLNPKKQNQYIARSAHPIISFNDLPAPKDKKIIVMNDNYRDEINQLIHHDTKLYSLRDLK